MAVKVLHPWAEQDEDSVRRLTEEAKTIAALRHPNIIGIKYFDRDRGRWFFSMDLMEGGTVAQRFQDETAHPRLAAELMEKVARAIHHAHTRNPGVLHLDLKPANVLLDAGGEPRVTDFGLAVRLESLSKPAGQAHRGRPGPGPVAGRGFGEPDQARGRRHLPLHVAGNGRGAVGRHLDRFGRLRPGRHPLCDAHGEAPLQGQERCGDPGAW